MSCPSCCTCTPSKRRHRYAHTSSFATVTPPLVPAPTLIFLMCTISFTRAQGIPKYKMGFGEGERMGFHATLTSSLHKTPKNAWLPIGTEQGKPGLPYSRRSLVRAILCFIPLCYGCVVRCGPIGSHRVLYLSPRTAAC
jgi:hypothetical protein